MSEFKRKRGIIATMRKKMVKEKDRETGKETEVEKRMFVFDKKFKATLDGQELDLGEFMSVFLKTKKELEESLDFSVKQGWTTEENANKQRDFYDEKQVVGAIEVKLKD